MTGAVFLLGGGLMQIPAIRAARELGLECHLADGNDRCIGRDLAGHFYHVDLRDREGLLAAAREIPDLRGVFTAGTDFSRSVAYVAEHLMLPGISEDVALRATDKGLMRRCLGEAGVSIPGFHVVTDDQSDPPFPLPVVVKPADNMGARGVALVRKREEYRHAVEVARELSVTKTVVVEEFINGQEYSLDALVVDGTVHITGIGRRHIFFPPHFVELGHTIPAELGADAEEALVREFERAIEAIGIFSGAAKGDVFLSRDGNGRYTATIGEIAARLSGGFMSGWTFPLATGVPLTRVALEIAVGERPDVASLYPAHQNISVERALISAPGTVAAVVMPGDLDPDVAEVFVHASAGDTVTSPKNNVEKVANVIVVSETMERAESIAVDVLDRIIVALMPANVETDRYFFEEGWTDTYRTYDAVGGDVHAFLAASMDIPGVLSRLQRSRRNGEGIAVADLPGRAEGVVLLRCNHISIDADVLLRRLVDEGTIRFDDAADGDITLLFWRAFLAGGRQGVRYLVDTTGFERGDV